MGCFRICITLDCFYMYVILKLYTLEIKNKMGRCLCLPQRETGMVVCVYVYIDMYTQELLIFFTES